MLGEAESVQAAGRLARAAHSPRRIILSGSYVHGDAADESDLYLMVVKDDIPDLSADYMRLRDALGTPGPGVDLLLYPQAELDRCRDWYSTPLY